MSTEIRQRNMVERLDGRMVNAGRLAGLAKPGGVA